MNAKTLAVAVAAMLAVAGGTAAVAGTGPEANETAGKADVIATYDEGTVTVTVGQGGDAVENATVEVAGETATTDPVGTATVGGVPVEDELEVEVEADGFEAELTYELSNGTLTLVEETYQYERGDGGDPTEKDDAGSDDGGDDESEEKRGPPEDVPADENAYEKGENGADDDGDDEGESDDGDDEGKNGADDDDADEGERDDDDDE